MVIKYRRLWIVRGRIIYILILFNELSQVETNNGFILQLMREMSMV